MITFKLNDKQISEAGVLSYIGAYSYRGRPYTVKMYTLFIISIASKSSDVTLLEYITRTSYETKNIKDTLLEIAKHIEVEVKDA